MKESYYQRNKEKILKKLRDNYEYSADRHLRSRYKISLDEVKKMYDEQKGCCYLCGNPGPIRGQKGLVVDHNHLTSVVRKLLCRSCNRVIGYLENSIWFERAKIYLGM